VGTGPSEALFILSTPRSLLPGDPMMNSAALLLCGCAGAVAVAACDSPSMEGPCTPNILFGLQVTVVDSLTNAPPASATLIARTAAEVDSVGPQSPFQPVVPGVVLVLSAAQERAGTYDLTVRAPGYRDWTRKGVRVTADRCHVRPVALTARLRT
jgi:hypothetical protein